MYVASRGKAVAWRRPPKLDFVDVALGSVRPGRRDALRARGQGRARILNRLPADLGEHIFAVETDFDTAALSGTVLVSGTAGGILEDQTALDTAALAGTVLVRGSLGATEGFFDSASFLQSLTLVSARHEYMTARGAVTGWRMATAPTSISAVLGALAAIDASADTAQILGSQLNYLAALEAPSADTASILAGIGVQGSIDAIDADVDTAAVMGEGTLPEVLGALDAVDIDFDVAALEGDVSVHGYLDAVEDDEDSARIRSGRAGASNWIPVPKDTGIWVRMN